jgi:hypothetical protein
MRPARRAERLAPHSPAIRPVFAARRAWISVPQAGALSSQREFTRNAT